MERVLVSKKDSAVLDTQKVVPVLEKLGKDAASSIICSVAGFLLLHVALYMSRYLMFFTQKK